MAFRNAARDAYRIMYKGWPNEHHMACGKAGAIIMSTGAAVTVATSKEKYKTPTMLMVVPVSFIIGGVAGVWALPLMPPIAAGLVCAQINDMT